MNYIALTKTQSLQRCVERAKEEYTAAGDNFLINYSRQDAAILNVIRACESAIDLANHLIRQRNLGVPSTNRESFELLCEAKLIPEDLGQALYKMAVFRNIAVHTYTKLDLAIVVDVIQNRLNDVLRFADIALSLA